PTSLHSFAERTGRGRGTMSATHRQQSAATTEARGEPIALCFSGGKASGPAFWEIQRQSSYAGLAMLITVSAEYECVSMHGVQRALVRDQADALGVRLTEVEVPPNSSNVVYEREMGRAFARMSAQGIRRVAFGDIFLQDLRTYRERQLAACGLE